MEELSVAQARRIALAAQGFTDRRHATPTLRTLERTVGRTGLLQIDSVNVVARAHLLPLYARMGPYDIGVLERATGRAPRRLVEYWAHCAAYIPPGTWPLLSHRMQRYAARGHAWFGLPDSPELPGQLLREIEQGGPATARELDDGAPRTREHWGWNWSASKKSLEYLFFSGRLAVARRNAAFERVYDLPERVLPAAVLAQPVPTEAEAIRRLTALAARSLGVGTESCLLDYYRLSTEPAGRVLLRTAIGELVEDGELVPTRVRGWRRAAYRHRDARLPRRVAARALLAPFDPVVWERARTEALFDFRYRIGIYTPQALREHGYYVLPFLLGDRPVARADLKADRAGRVLLVQGAFAEPSAPAETVVELAAELESMAGWLGLSQVRVGPVGDLARPLAAALR